MLKERITEKIEEVLRGGYGFDVYIAMKDGEERIKRFVLEEGRPTEHDGFKDRVRNSIVGTINEKFLSEDRQYVTEDALADEQDRIFVIGQSQDYAPFSYLETPDEDIQNFSLDDKEKADAVLFKFIKWLEGEAVVLWAYQKIQPSAIPNKQKRHFQIRAKSPERPDVFEEMRDQMFMITQTVDVLILGNEMITGNVKLMERHFGLEEFIRASAARAVHTIETVHLVNNVEKLQEYVRSPNKRYARNMMTIHQYPVSGMSKEALLAKLRTVERWKNVFELQEDGIRLRNFSDVEQLIDLFIERYTKSEITDQEYDTKVKERAVPRSAE